MAGKLRQALEDMVSENLQAHGIKGWWERLKSRSAEADGWLDAYLKRPGASWISVPFGLMWAGIAYTYGGSKSARALGLSYTQATKIPDISDQMAALLTQVEGSAALLEVAKVYGAMFATPFETFFNKFAGQEDFDVEDFIRTMHGLPATINLQAGAIGALAEIAGLGQFDAFNDMAASMQQVIPARQLNTRLIVPMIDAGIGGNVTRFFNRKYRPTRFKASDLRDLYALGEVAQADVQAGASAEGWRDQDIALWIKLAFRKMAQGDIFTAWHKGLIPEAEMVGRLRALGYDPADIPLLVQLNPDPEAARDKDASASDVRAAFRAGVVSEAQLRSLLAATGYTAAAIDLIVSIERAKQQIADSSLTIGEIKSAWSDNVLTDQEARHWLAEAGVEAERAEILLATWRHEIAPRYARLNAGTILEAYVAGVLNRGLAKTRLTEVGFTDDDAELQIRLAELRNPAVFGGPTPAQATRIGPSELAGLVALGLINPAQMSLRLTQSGYTAEDAALLAEAARLRAQPAERTLPESIVLTAYLDGLIERIQAGALLAKLGYTADQAGLILDTFEAEHAVDFGVAAPTRPQTLGQASLEQLYLTGNLDGVTYRARLAALGYNAADVDLIVARDDQLLTPLPRPLLQSAIEQAYIAGVYDRNTAYNRLIASDYTPADAATLLDTVEARNPATFSPGLVQSIRVPSIGTLVAALQNGVVSQDEYTARATELGYSTADAQLYIALAVTAEHKASKSLSLGQVQQAYNQGILSRGIALARVVGMGYSDDDATLLLRITKESLVLTDTWDALLSGALGPYDAIAALVSASYSDEDIYAAFAALDPLTLARLQIDLAQLKLTLTAIPGGA